MPDQPRKLPVIQVATMNNGGALATDKDGFGLFHRHDSMGQFELGFALYEPSIPRCAACGHRREDEHGLFCAKLKDSRGNPKPVTLTGYCDQHPEASR
jgi:hypothetical protein